MGDVGEPRLSAERPDLEFYEREYGSLPKHAVGVLAQYALALEAELVVVRERAERLSKLIVEQEREYAKERKTLRERAERLEQALKDVHIATSDPLIDGWAVARIEEMPHYKAWLAEQEKEPQ